jgi:hypothetical protein
MIRIRSDINNKYSNSNQPSYKVNIDNGIKNYSQTPDYTKSKLNIFVPSPDIKSFNLLNSNIDKRFHNYFLNSNSNETGISTGTGNINNTRVVSTHSNRSNNLSDFKDKFNEKIYLK